MSQTDNFSLDFKPRSNNWTSLRAFNVYGIGIASIFFSQSFIEESPLLTISDLSLYAWTSFAYLSTTLVMTLFAWIDRRNFQLQVSIHTYVDIIAIILLMHACGGINSGLGMLLIISIAVTGVLSRNSLATVFASLASVGLLAEHYIAVTNTSFYGTSTQVGILGAALFATALVTQTLTRRIASSEAMIQQQKLDVANLSALNSQILQNMQSGVLALDRLDQVRHINDMAKMMLLNRFNHPEQTLNVPFETSSILPEIYQSLQDWRSTPAKSSSLLSSGKGNLDMQISFHDIQSPSHQGTLIFLDDVSRLKHQMQQAKLASLGHLTASIAHEIRNPLGAISHAGQLLAENEELPPGEKRLTEIIQQHSDRINDIIEDVMQISRGHIASQESIDLKKWMKHFIDSFHHGNTANKNIINLELGSDDLKINFDNTHLSRIMTNLCSNALTHGLQDKPVHIRIHSDGSDPIYIEVADEGPGINNEELEKIFDPFYTTGHKGSGLGLYIVSQLCELNNSTIEVTHNQFGGASFILSQQPEIRKQTG